MTGQPPAIPDAAATLAADLRALLVAQFQLEQRERVVIGIAGESGSGKTVTAVALERAFHTVGIASAILHQDDYFLRPPRANHEYRIQDLAAVGPHEVNRALMQAHIAAFRARQRDVRAPKVDYPSDSFLTHQHDFRATRVLLVEGTYALGLDDLDVRIFLEATHADTRARRRLRNRDIDAPVIEAILDIEHDLIAPQASSADIVIDRDFRIVTTP